MSLKSKFKRTLSGLLSMAMVATIVPCFPVSAEDSEKYPYTMFASSNEDGAITVNAYNFTINGQIATNGTVNSMETLTSIMRVLIISVSIWYIFLIKSIATSLTEEK